MTNMVDSTKRQLNSAEIVTIALQNTKSKYDAKTAFTAILSEMSQPNTDVKQVGNTLFVLHKGKNKQGFFKALNADVPKNFLSASKNYAVYAKRKLGMKALLTEFEDRAISTLFTAISKDPPMPGMGFQEFKLKNGKSQILLNLGD